MVVGSLGGSSARFASDVSVELGSENLDLVQELTAYIVGKQFALDSFAQPILSLVKRAASVVKKEHDIACVMASIAFSNAGADRVDRSDQLLPNCASREIVPGIDLIPNARADIACHHIHPDVL